jgi:hypothetical protein
MKLKLSVAIVCLSLLSACGSGSDKDGVPTVSDYENIVVDGKPMKHEEFLNKYCVGKANNETCLRVSHAHFRAIMKTQSELKW